MEELRSTDVLDKEIQSDARKKAERILSNAETDGRKIEAAVSERIAVTTKEKNAAYEEKLAVFKRNVEAALPLECERYLVSYEGSSVADAINDYLNALSDEKRVSLLKKLIDRSKDILSGKNISVSFYGIEQATAEKLLKDAFGQNIFDKNVSSVSKITFEQSGESACAGLNIHEGIIVESDDKMVKCRFSLDQLISELEDTYSYELASTLFGGRLPE
ncbi:MAG: hypothetical protein K6F69_10895 [Treponema sp.]|nr:hypothetical protein [Treponema sp.]